MNKTNFIYWLRGYLDACGGCALNQGDVKQIDNRLSMLVPTKNSKKKSISNKVQDIALEKYLKEGHRDV